MNQARGAFSINEIFIPALTFLYAIHKGYKIHLPSDNFKFVHDDRLYRDLATFSSHKSALIENFIIKFAEEKNIVNLSTLNAVYVDLLRGLFDRLARQTGRTAADFYTPSSINKLMAYFVHKEGCKKIFDPFCGTASIIHELSQLGETPVFTGQEINLTTALFARLIAEAIYGSDDYISNNDSILDWSYSSYDAVVACPPLGLRLTTHQIYDAVENTEYNCRSINDIVIGRSFDINKAKMTITLLPTSFCFKGGCDYETRREYLERNLIDTIIALPDHILYGTNVPSILLICKSGRQTDDPIKFIHAEEYHLGDLSERTFNYDLFIEMFEGDRCDVTEVSLEQIRQFDYNLNPSLYHEKDFDLKPGQRLFRLEELICPVDGDRISSTEVKEAISISTLSKDFMEVLLNNSKVSAPDEVKRNMIYRSIDSSDSKYILATSTLQNRYGINTDGKGFVWPSVIKVYKVNEDLVTPEYLAYILINHKAISKGQMSLSNYMKLPLVIDSLDTQKHLVDKEIQQYNQRLEAEREADALRLGVKQNVSDLEHMLGSTQVRIGKIISRLEKATPSTENYQRLVKSMKDNVEYMNRIIHYNNARIDAESFNIKEGDIADFINNDVDAWNNYGGEYFELSIQNRLLDEVKMSFDKTLLTVMLDSILNNAIRHGFHKRKNYTDHNSVQIGISLVEYNEYPYVQVAVANNGDPIADGFTINDYTSRGRYAASTGRSGLGGHHVYQIAKGHKGYLYLDSNKVWNTIVEVLLPIESTMSNEIPVYENECV